MISLLYRQKTRGPVDPSHIDINMWYAWHYGENATNNPSVVQTRDTGKANSSHREYFDKKKQQEKENRSREKLGENKADYDPLMYQRLKREMDEALKHAESTTEVAPKTSSDRRRKTSKGSEYDSCSIS